MNYNSSRNKTHQFSMKHAPNWYFMIGFSTTTTKNRFSSSSNFQTPKKSTRTWEPGLVTSKLHHPGSWRRKIGKNLRFFKGIEAQLLPIIFGIFLKMFSFFSASVLNRISCFFWNVEWCDPFWREDIINLAHLASLGPFAMLKKNPLGPFLSPLPWHGFWYIHLGPLNPLRCWQSEWFQHLTPGFIGLCHSPPRKKTTKRYQLLQ